VKNNGIQKAMTPILRVFLPVVIVIMMIDSGIKMHQKQSDAKFNSGKTLSFIQL
jgi:hypothetical protein